MSLTVVVSARCDCVVMRPAICSRLQAGVLPDDRDHRNADVRKDVDRRAQRRQRPDDENNKREHDESIGTPQCDADERNHAMTTSPPATARECAVNCTFLERALQSSTR